MKEAVTRAFSLAELENYSAYIANTKLFSSFNIFDASFLSTTKSAIKKLQGMPHFGGFDTKSYQTSLKVSLTDEPSLPLENIKYLFGDHKAVKASGSEQDIMAYERYAIFLSKLLIDQEIDTSIEAEKFEKLFTEEDLKSIDLQKAKNKLKEKLYENIPEYVDRISLSDLITMCKISVSKQRLIHKRLVIVNEKNVGPMSNSPVGHCINSYFWAYIMKCKDGPLHL